MKVKEEQHRTISTLAMALQWLNESELSENKKRDLRSAVETACHWFKRAPQEVAADPVALRCLIEGALGVSKKRRANVQWAVRRLLELAGNDVRAACR